MQCLGSNDCRNRSQAEPYFRFNIATVGLLQARLKPGPNESSDQCFFVHNIKQCNCEEGADAMFADRELPKYPPMCTVSPVELEEFRPDRNTGDDLTRWLKGFRFPIPWPTGVNS